MKRLIIILFFGALIGTQFKVIQGVSLADFVIIPLLFYSLMNIQQLRINRNLIAKYSLGYSLLLLFSGLINETITNTIFLNFTRVLIEGTIAFCSLSIALRTEKELHFFTTLFYAYSVYFAMSFSSSLSATIAEEGDFNLLVIQNGRNVMAVTNLLIIMMLSFMLLTSQAKKEKLIIAVFPFLFFNILFSASRFSVISLLFLGVFLLYWMRNKISMRNSIIILALILALLFLVRKIESGIDANVMEYSSELLSDKITKNEDGGFAYRLYNLNIVVITDWLDKNSIYMWLFGDGISITHGIFSFTFCCTGVIGFFYFLLTNIRMVWAYMRRSKTGQYISFVIFVFFINDIVTNSRFIIGLNTLLYMGILAFMLSFEMIEKIKKDENNHNTYKIQIK